MSYGLPLTQICLITLHILVRRVKWTGSGHAVVTGSEATPVTLSSVTGSEGHGTSLSITDTSSVLTDSSTARLLGGGRGRETPV